MATMTFDEGRREPKPVRKPVTRTKMTIWFIVMLLIVGGLGGGLWWFNNFRNQMIAGFFANMKQPPTPVAAAAADSGEMSQYLEGIGSLVAVRQVNIAPEVDGRVIKILFEPGMTVAAGQTLVDLNDAPEQAQLVDYQAQKKLAESDLSRTQKLVGRDFATQASLDQNQLALDQANAGIVRTNAIIDQKRIDAPFAGVLGIRQVEVGQQVRTSDTLVTLTNLDSIYANFTLPEQDRGKVTLGSKIEVLVDAYPGKMFDGTLTAIEPQIDPGTRTIKIQATIPNPEHLLLPGMFANTRVILPPIDNVVTVPETAVLHTLYGDSVYVVTTDGQGEDGKPLQKAVQTFVKTGDARDGRIAITEGVAKGDLIVGSGQLKLQSGAPVTIVKDTDLVKPATIPQQ